MLPVRASSASPSATPAFTLVASPEGLEEVMAALVGARRLAIDIEADSLYHYYEKVCLIQVSTDQWTYVIDPLAIRHLAPLGALMADPAREKVFHAATYDLLSLRRDHGFVFSNIFDTHIAAQLIGCDKLGLGGLLEEQLGVVHSKHRQRDDWSRRPLTAEQLAYAAADTHYLLQLRDAFEQKLRAYNRLSWAQEEFRILLKTEVREKAFDPEACWNIRGCRDLTPEQQAILRALYILRDRYARAMDVPPFKVFNNGVLLDLARRPPLYPKELLRRPGIAPRLAQRFGEEIFRTIRKSQSREAAGTSSQERKPWKPFSAEAQSRLEKLKTWRRSKAKELRLPVGVVFPGSLLETLAAAPPSDMAGLTGINGLREWRCREFGQEILRVLSA